MERNLIRRRSLVLLPILVVAGIWMVLGHREPRYGGRPIGYWLEQSCYLERGNRFSDASKAETLKAFRAIGTNAIPYLLPFVLNTNGNSEIWAGLHSTLSRRPYIGAQDYNTAAWAALREIQPPSSVLFPHLRPFLESTHYGERHIVLWLAGCAGEGGEKFVPYLTAGLKDSNAWTRALSAQSLSFLGKRAKNAIPDLIAAIDDPAARFNAITALGAIGPEARTALPRLAIEFAGTDLRYVVRSAVSTLAIDPKNTAAFSVVQDALQSTNKADRIEAIWSLRSQETVARRFFPNLLENVGSPDGDVWSAAAETIRAIDPSDPRAVPLLAAKLTDRRNVLNAALCLIRFDPNQPDGIKVLIDILQDRTSLYRAIAADALGEAGSTSDPVIPALKAASEDTDTAFRIAPKRALQQILRKKEKRQSAP